MGSVDVYDWSSKNWKERQEELEMLKEAKVAKESKEEDYKKAVFVNENLYIPKGKKLTHRKIGEINTSNRGQKMKIVGYRKSTDIDILFEDGTLVEHKQYHDFLNGKIRNPNFKGAIKRIEQMHLGETNLASNGQKMTIIAYRKNNDIDIQFEDGVIVKKARYNEFKNGYIKNPNVPLKRHSDKRIKEYGDARIGETRTSRNGQKMTIIEYRGARDLDVKFEDGTIVKKIQYTAFKAGRVANPNYAPEIIGYSKDKYLGKEFITKKGLKVKIVNYRNLADIDVELEDGTIIEHVWGNPLIRFGYLIKHKGVK